MHLHKKKQGSKVYYYLREIKRVDGKPKVTSQIYLGNANKVATLLQRQKGEIKTIKSFEYGIKQPFFCKFLS